MRLGFAIAAAPNKFAAPGRILVIRGGAIGDFILTLPALGALRAQFPHVHLEVLGYPHITQLALTGGVVDAVRSIEAGPLAGFFARGGTLSPELCAYFSSFAVIVSYLYDPDLIFQNNVTSCATGQFISGPHRPDEQDATPAAEVFLQPLRRLAIFDADPVPRLCLTPRADGSGGSGPLHAEPWLAIHPGSGSQRKNWPIPRWIELSRHVLGKTSWKLLVIGGEADAQSLDALLAELPSDRIELVRNLSLTELAYRMKKCHAFLGHDSGISHLAGALALPGCVLWGDTNEAIWKPPHPAVQVLRNVAGLSGLEVETVFAEVERLMQRPVPKS